MYLAWVLSCLLAQPFHQLLASFFSRGITQILLTSVFCIQLRILMVASLTDRVLGRDSLRYMRSLIFLPEPVVTTTLWVFHSFTLTVCTQSFHKMMWDDAHGLRISTLWHAFCRLRLKLDDPPLGTNLQTNLVKLSQVAECANRLRFHLSLHPPY